MGSLNMEPLFDKIQSHARFESLVGRVGLPLWLRPYFQSSCRTVLQCELSLGGNRL